MNDQFEICVCNDLGYEKPVAEIHFNECIVGIINQDNGIDNLEITITSSLFEKDLKLMLKDLQEVIEKAKQALIESNKTD